MRRTLTEHQTEALTTLFAVTVARLEVPGELSRDAPTSFGRCKSGTRSYRRYDRALTPVQRMRALLDVVSPSCDDFQRLLILRNGHILLLHSIGLKSPLILNGGGARFRTSYRCM